MAHFNASDVYFGTYARFDTVNKTEGAALSGPDNAIGDRGTIVWHTDKEKRQQAWLKNPYNFEIGYLDPVTSYKLAVYEAKGWKITYVLSYVAYSDKPDPGIYWGEAALIAYNPHYAEQFEQFLKSFSQRMSDGLRPDPELSPVTIEAIVQDPSSWKPSSKVKIPHKKDTTIIKDHRTAHDKLLDQARGRNPGCYVVSWAFIIAVILAILWVIHSMGII